MADSAVVLSLESSFDPMAAPTNKRKRTTLEQVDSSRDNPELTQYEDGSALQELLRHNAEGAQMNGGNQSATDTAAAALSYSHGLPDLQFSQSTGDNDASFQGTGFSLDALKDGAGQSSPTAPGGAKPPVGSEEWHKVRRDNHKEVERRRRETINEGINELSKIVPGCEKNKGSILQRAVQYISQLKENENQNIEKWTLEKLLLDQAITELSSSCDRLKAEAQAAKSELDVWKRACHEHGIVPDEFKGKAEGSGGDDS